MTDRTHEGRVEKIIGDRTVVSVPGAWNRGDRVSITRLTRTLEEATFDALRDHRIGRDLTISQVDADRLVRNLRSHGVQLLGPDDPDEPPPTSLPTDLARLQDDVLQAMRDAGLEARSVMQAINLMTSLRSYDIHLTRTPPPDSRPTRRRSRDASAGMYLLNTTTGHVQVIRERKQDDSGWWFAGGGGLADVVADAPGSTYYFLREAELVEHLEPELRRRYGRA